MKKMNVTVFRPPVDVLHKFSKPVECLAIGYLAASLRLDEHNVRMLDGMMYKWSVKESVNEILVAPTDVLCMTNVVQYFPEETIRIIQLLRKRNYNGFIFVGGHSLSFFPERILRGVPGLDAVIVGEGEESIREVVNAIATGGDWKKCNGVATLTNGQFHLNPVKRIASLDALPYPARDLTREIIRNDGLVCISTSRGCYARCTFCSVPRFYGLENSRKHSSGDWRFRSVNNVVAEIVELYNNFGLYELLIVDDEFFGGTEIGLARAYEFGKAMEALNIPLQFALSCRAENVNEEVFRQLKRGGLTHVFVGLESGVHDELKLFAKGHSVEQNRNAVQIIKSMGLTFQPGFMMINHRSTLNSIKNNIAFLEEIGECKPVTLNSIVDPHFGAPLTDFMNKEQAVKDHGLSLEPVIHDKQVMQIMKVIETCSRSFQQYMNVIAAFHSAVTFEWRRTIPGRTQEIKQLLNALEDHINNRFVWVVKEAINDIETTDATDELIAKNTRSRIASLKRKLKMIVPLVVQQIEEKEGQLKYYSQEAIMQ